MTEDRNLPLPLFLARTIREVLPILNDERPLSLPASQATLAKALDDLYLVARITTSLGIFSENEDVEELGDGELVFMVTGWLLGDMESRTGLGGYSDRISCLRRSDAAYTSFLHLSKAYGLNTSEHPSEGSPTTDNDILPEPSDPAQRREAKIRQYKREKELRERISSVIPGELDKSSHPASFILGIVSANQDEDQQSTSTSVNPEPAVQRRQATLLLLELLQTLTISSLSHNTMELELLASAPSDHDSSMSSSSAPPRTDEDADNTWRLDRTAGQYKPRELISGGGRVMRPFTILPSTKQMSDRERLKGEVFRNGHRLPTMTIDEYLDEERSRGNVITGGGQASADAPTTSELLALEADNDGTMRGDEASEEQRIKAEYWAQYGELNKKGAGNTTNRG